MSERPTMDRSPGEHTPASTGIVVGLDGTPDAYSALRWAEAHTDLFDRIRPVLTWHYPIYVWLPKSVRTAAPPAETMQAAAENAARACVEQVPPDRIVAPVVVEGEAGPVLVDEAKNAALLVVGARDLGLVRSWVLGSVGRYCADHTVVPLVIVPESDADVASDSTTVTPRQIAVGVDGSTHSEDALRWAIRNSRPEDTITAHTAWHYLGGLGYETYAIEAPVLERAAVETQTRTVERITTELDVDPYRVRRDVDCGDPRSVLRSIGAEVDLLVIGQRGRSGLPYFFLGSTTTSLIHRPVCPIAVIPSVEERPVGEP